MKRYKLFYNLIIILFFWNFFVNAQISVVQSADKNNELIFLSDTQAPIWVETVLLPPNRNTEATDSLYTDILRQKPLSLFILGDLTSAGADLWLWEPIDKNIASLRKQHIPVYALMGNHEYMFIPSAGKKYFKSRFPKQSITGYNIIVDSIAIIMLNSNFNNLSTEEFIRQNTWYKKIMDSLEIDNKVKTIIVACHHAPFTNSKVVESSKDVQNFFVPKFIKNKKAKIFITGHSHNLEHFKQLGKDFFVIGGGGGLKQPLYPENNRPWNDLISNDKKPLYFYIKIIRDGNNINVFARGSKNTDFNNFFDLELSKIKID